MNFFNLKIWVNLCLKKCLGEDATSSLFRKIYVRRLLKAGVIFIHIPRAAGTSIANEVIGRRAGHLTATEIKRQMGEDLYNTMFSFSVVRNPYDRLVSAYYYAKNRGGEHGGITPNRDYKRPSFSTFERFILEWLPGRNIHALDYVFQPQYQFVFERDVLQVDYLGKLENLDEVEKVVGENLKRTIRFNRYNQSKRGKDFAKYYNEPMRQVVQDIYMQDFKKLGYEP